MARPGAHPDPRAGNRTPPRPILDEFTVLIPTLGRPTLKGCLETIAAGTVWPARVIVVDQGVNPGVADWLRALEGSGIPATHVRSRQRGVAAAQNRGIERVESRFLAETHDDCRVAADWLEKMAERLRQCHGVIVTGRVLPPAGGVAPSTITREESVLYDRPQIRQDPLFPNNMGFAVEIARRVGAFDESPLLRVSEDNDWSYRALRKGIAFQYAPEVVVTHLDWRSPEQMAEVYRGYARAQGALFGKYVSRGDAFMALRAALALVRGPLSWLRGLLRKDEDMITSGRARTLYLLPGIWAGLRWRWKDSP